MIILFSKLQQGRSVLRPVTPVNGKVSNTTYKSDESSSLNTTFLDSLSKSNDSCKNVCQLRFCETGLQWTPHKYKYQIMDQIYETVLQCCWWPRSLIGQLIHAPTLHASYHSVCRQELWRSSCQLSMDDQSARAQQEAFIIGVLATKPPSTKASWSTWMLSGHQPEARALLPPPDGLHRINNRRNGPWCLHRFTASQVHSFTGSQVQQSCRHLTSQHGPETASQPWLIVSEFSSHLAGERQPGTSDQLSFSTKALCFNHRTGYHLACPVLRDVATTRSIMPELPSDTPG